MRRLFFLLSADLAFNHFSALPDFDPFAKATANGVTSYEAGSALTGQFNSALFNAWYLHGADNIGA